MTGDNAHDTNPSLAKRVIRKRLDILSGRNDFDYHRMQSALNTDISKLLEFNFPDVPNPLAPLKGHRIILTPTDNIGTECHLIDNFDFPESLVKVLAVSNSVFPANAEKGPYFRSQPDLPPPANWLTTMQASEVLFAYLNLYHADVTADFWEKVTRDAEKDLYEFKNTGAMKKRKYKDPLVFMDELSAIQAKPVNQRTMQDLMYLESCFNVWQPSYRIRTLALRISSNYPDYVSRYGATENSKTTYMTLNPEHVIIKPNHTE